MPEMESTLISGHSLLKLHMLAYIHSIIHYPMIIAESLSARQIIPCRISQ